MLERPDDTDGANGGVRHLPACWLCAFVPGLAVVWRKLSPAAAWHLYDCCCRWPRATLPLLLLLLLPPPQLPNTALHPQAN